MSRDIIGNTIHSRMYSARQSANYEEIIELTSASDVNRLKIDIKVDSYQDQNICKISRWDGAEWKYVASIPPSEMRSGDISYKKELKYDEDFVDDRYDLINLACLVIWGAPWKGQQ